MKHIIAIIAAAAYVIVTTSTVQGIMVTWNPNTEHDLAGYRAYVCTTYTRAQAKNGDIATGTIGVSSSPSYTYDESANVNQLFIGLTAYEFGGNESTASICYHLYGNIVGGYFDNTPYTQARVDGMDLITLGLHFNKRAPFDSGEAARCDLDKNNRIDGMDLIELGLRFNNRAYQQEESL